MTAFDRDLVVDKAAPRSEFIWEAADIESVVAEFREYLKAAWEEGCYLKIE